MIKAPKAGAFFVPKSLQKRCSATMSMNPVQKYSVRIESSAGNHKDESESRTLGAYRNDAHFTLVYGNFYIFVVSFSFDLI